MLTQNNFILLSFLIAVGGFPDNVSPASLVPLFWNKTSLSWLSLFPKLAGYNAFSHFPFLFFVDFFFCACSFNKRFERSYLWIFTLLLCTAVSLRKFWWDCPPYFYVSEIGSHSQYGWKSLGHIWCSFLTLAVTFSLDSILKLFLLYLFYVINV